MEISQSGLSLVKSFEGLYLSSYYCPSNVLTIGWGHTGPDVQEGMRITEAQAEAFLRQDMQKFEKAVLELIEVDLSQYQFDALVSFSFNCGSNALRTSTMRRRLNEREAVCVVLREELPKWVNGSTGPLPGLVRRRQAEIDHACGKDLGKTEEDDFILKAVAHYVGLEHQEEAFLGLWNHITPELQEWFVKAYRNEASAWEPHETDHGEEFGDIGFPLEVPYYYQRDSKTGHGERMCFSSSMAMAMDYLDPEAIEGDDDWYLNVVFKYGDSVSSAAQLAAAQELGFDPEFRMDASEQDLLDQLDRNIPVPIGILHKGHVDSPSGGGHWICLIGYDEKNFHVHDPFGELELVPGGYKKIGPEDGRKQVYTRKNLMKRWLIANDHDGWGMFF